jgi:CHASE3 domain sensor protein
MRLTTKGLLLIAIPALFELALLSGLVKAQSDAALAERWAIHSEEVLRQTAAILDPVMGESVALRGAVLAHDTHFTTPLAVWMDVDRRIDRLAELVADNPAQVERVMQMRQSVQAYRQWSDRIQDMLHSGRRHDVIERFQDLAEADVLDRFRQEAVSFQTDERRIDTLRSSAADEARERQQTLIVAAALGSLLFVALAVWLFTRGVRGRLALLSDNAGRLAGNEPLAPLTPGHDEIAPARSRAYPGAFPVRSRPPRRRTRTDQRDAAAADPGKRNVHLQRVARSARTAGESSRLLERADSRVRRTA